MKNQRVVIVCIIIFFFLSISMLSEVNGMYLFQDPEMPAESEKASTSLSRSLSIWFTSLKALEHKALAEAKGLKNKMFELLGKVLGLHEQIRKKTPDKPIIKKNIPSEKLEKILKDFCQFGLVFPVSKKKLSDISIQQIGLFTKYVSSVDFAEDPSVNRQLIIKMNDKIWQLVLVGVHVSEIAASVR